MPPAPTRLNLLRGLILVAALGIASAAYQQISDARDRRRFPPPGRLVDIGGRRLHVYEAGEGSPAVVIVPAVADGVLEWMTITRRLAGSMHVCVYDRVGIGFSDPPGRGSRAIDGMADDLHALLTQAGIELPCVLAGHSLGGVIARRFITRYPGAVCGLLLIDSSHENQARRLPFRGGAGSNLWWALRRQTRILGARRAAAAFGLLRSLDADIAREFPPEFAGAARANILSTHRRRVAVRELILLTRRPGQPPRLGSLPLTVLTSAEAGQRLNGRPWRARPAWERLQAELAALSTDSSHITASKAGHYIHLDEPELVIEAIRDLIGRCRPI